MPSSTHSQNVLRDIARMQHRFYYCLPITGPDNEVQMRKAYQTFSARLPLNLPLSRWRLYCPPRCTRPSPTFCPLPHDPNAPGCAFGCLICTVYAKMEDWKRAGIWLGAYLQRAGAGAELCGCLCFTVDCGVVHCEGVRNTVRGCRTGTLNPHNRVPLVVLTS